MWGLVFEVLKSVYNYCGKYITTLMFIVIASGAFVYHKYDMEVKYHSFAKSIEAHKHDECEIKDRFVRCHWVLLPKVPNKAFTETWELYYPEAGGWIEIKSFKFERNSVAPYREHYSDVYPKSVDFYGQYVHIPYDLPPGTYEIRVAYTYNEFNWFYDHWIADQRIIFKIEP